jgi:hypothetical protein
VNATQEQWRPVVGYEGLYEVSDLGRVRSLARRVPHGRLGHITVTERILKPVAVMRGGYASVMLSQGGAERHYKVHHLVLCAFVGPMPEGDAHTRHLNDLPTDNRLVNLKWGTRAENMRDAVRNGGHYNASKTRCIHGHEYTPENTVRQPTGRKCRECKNAYERRRYRRDRA